MPVVRLLNSILHQAIKDRASDVHFEVFDTDFRIRYRVDGALYEIEAPPAHLALPLVARIKVLLRRLSLPAGAGSEEQKLEVAALVLDLQRYTASWSGRDLPLTVTEFLIVRALARHPGHVKTRQQLMQEGYPHDAYVSERTIDSHIKRIRRKLSQAGAEPTCVETVHGLGYRWHPESG